MNPFTDRARSIHGPAPDPLPVTPDDSADLSVAAFALYIETSGTVVVDTIVGETRTVAVADFSILPMGIVRVQATGTTAASIHALVLT